LQTGNSSAMSFTSRQGVYFHK